MSEIKIYNSLSRKKERLTKPTASKPLRLFVCGPTVYDEAHIGHARTYIFFDFFTKYLRGLGLSVKYVQNITDVDDKIIARAGKERKDPLALAAYFSKRYLADVKTLGINSVDVYAPATKFIPQIVLQILTLVRKGYAYEIPGDGWYFDTAKFKDYGKLSGRSAWQAEDAVSRIDDSVHKRNRADFCLWKFPHGGGGRGKKQFLIVNREPVWNTPLGFGRPGWHIEDTAISEHYFGPQYEIHGGGLDLKIPHHEAEIAQQEAASGKRPFVKIWMHTGMLTVNGKKMSKSLGNFITIKEYLEKHSGDTLRLAALSHHYRSPMDYNNSVISDASKAIESAKMFVAKLAEAAKQNGKKTLRATPYSKKFFASLEDDINTPGAIAALFEAINKVNPFVWNLEKKSADEIAKFVKSGFETFGVALTGPKIPQKIRRLAGEREKFRGNKQFAQSDALRKKINGLGYKVEDTPVGPFIWPVK